MWTHLKCPFRKTVCLYKWILVGYLRNETCSPCLHSLAKNEVNVLENSRADQWKGNRSWGFSPAREFSQTLPKFSPGYEGTDNMLHLFYKTIIFRLKEEKDNIRGAYVYFNFFHETTKHVIVLLYEYFLFLYKVKFYSFECTFHFKTTQLMKTIQ